MRLSAWIAAFGLGAALLVAKPARAEQPLTTNHLQPAFGFRYGAKLGDGSVNPWGLGLGLELGYTLPSAVYLSGSFDYFFGEKSTNLWEVMAHAGYDIGIGSEPQLVLRPKVGLGAATLTAGDSATHLVAAPGVTLLLLTPGFLLAFDTRLDLVFAGGAPAKALVFSAGIGF